MTLNCKIWVVEKLEEKMNGKRYLEIMIFHNGEIAV